MVRRVVGDSMMPRLRAGQVVIGIVHPKILSAGDVVIVQHDKLEKIKRVQQVSDEGVFVVGDNAAQSTDSRSFGWLPLSAVRARLIWPRAAAR